MLQFECAEPRYRPVRWQWSRTRVSGANCFSQFWQRVVRYTSHCSFDNVSMDMLTDIFHAMRQIIELSHEPRYTIFIAAEVIRRVFVRLLVAYAEYFMPLIHAYDNASFLSDSVLRKTHSRSAYTMNGTPGCYNCRIQATCRPRLAVGWCSR